MVLENERRGGNIGEHAAHGKGLCQGEEHEGFVLQGRAVGAEGLTELSGSPPGNRQGFLECERIQEQEDSQAKQNPKNTFPRGCLEQDSSQNRSEYRRQPLDGAEQGEEAAQGFPLVKIRGDSPGNDHASRPGNPLQETEKEETLDAGCKNAPSRGQAKEQERTLQGNFASVLVAEGTDEDLPDAKPYHAEGEAQLDSGSRTLEVIGQGREGRQVKVGHKRAERRDDAAENEYVSG